MSNNMLWWQLIWISDPRKNENFVKDNPMTIQSLFVFQQVCSFNEKVSYS